MSICALVLDRVHIKVDGRVRQQLGRIIIGFQGANKDNVKFVSKYIHYPSTDFVHHGHSFAYNGIDATTLSKQGEKYSTVIAWARAAIHSRSIIVCGMADVKEVVGDTPCKLIDLQDFFYTEKNNQISEPISLNRLAKKVFGYDASVKNRRDPFDECQLKIALYHVMSAFKIIGRVPPFEESVFPKVPKFPFHSVSKQDTRVKEGEDDMCEKSKKTPPTPCSSPQVAFDAAAADYDDWESPGAFMQEPENSPPGDHVVSSPVCEGESMLRFQGEHDLSSQSRCDVASAMRKKKEGASLRDHTYENDSDSKEDLVSQDHDDDDDGGGDGIYSSQVFKRSHYIALKQAREQSARARRPQPDGGRVSPQPTLGQSCQVGFHVKRGAGRGMSPQDVIKLSDLFDVDVQNRTPHAQSVTRSKASNGTLCLRGKVEDDEGDDDGKNIHPIVVNVNIGKKESKWKRCTSILSCVIDF